MHRIGTGSFVLVLVALFWFSGCVGSSSVVAPLQQGVEEGMPPALEAYADARVLEAHLRDAAEGWYGTPYRYGGTGRDGIDCSAFVQTLYRDALRLSLPRVTAEQVHEGVALRSGTAYQPGDLVFFRPTPKTRHVGLYLGRGEFVHAGTSEGVTLASLDDPYWQSVFWTARRILPEVALPEGRVAAEPARAPRRPPASWSRPATARRSARAGW